MLTVQSNGDTLKILMVSSRKHSGGSGGTGTAFIFLRRSSTSLSVIIGINENPNYLLCWKNPRLGSVSSSALMLKSISSLRFFSPVTYLPVKVLLWKGD